jgi:hypothetical protein
VSVTGHVRRELSESQLEAWTRFLRAHSALTRELEAELGSGHELTLSDYDVLVQLAQAPGRRLRPVELSRAVLLTRSGVTRLGTGSSAPAWSSASRPPTTSAAASSR